MSMYVFRISKPHVPPQLRQFEFIRGSSLSLRGPVPKHTLPALVLIHRTPCAPLVTWNCEVLRLIIDFGFGLKVNDNYNESLGQFIEFAFVIYK